jgi:dipeptidyl aminopeptidase/acylaminoacyl peptidase
MGNAWQWLTLVGILVSAGAAADEGIGPMTFEDLFRDYNVKAPSMSPDGRLVAYFRGDTLIVGEPGGEFSELRDFSSRLSFEDISWIGATTLWITSWDGKYNRFLYTAVRFSEAGEDGFELAAVEDHKNRMLLIDPLFNDDDRVVVSVPKWKDDVVSASLYSVNALAPLEDQFESRNRIKTGSNEFFYYQPDAAGNYALGIRIAEGTPELWRRLPGTRKWSHVWTADRESVFVPVAMSADAKTLWVLSNAQTDKVVAAEFDLDTNSFGDTLFAHRRVDVDDIVMSPDGTRPIGVSYTEGGLVQYAFFAARHDDEFETIKAHFPGQGVIRIGHSPNSGRQLVFASSTSMPGNVHVCDVREDWCELIDSIAPWLDGQQLSETTALRVESTDGIVVDAYLTLPAHAEDSVPLLALPHGGPIGISDRRYFSSEVQWLAHNGYAVLQVNYRGSGGYGASFERAGLREWGRGIEDDIEAAVYKVLDENPVLDPERVGIFGASYGGYSALMSVIRNPELFKCAASFAGVMDLTLLFTQSAARQQSDELRDILIDYVGDPHIDFEEQVENSPVYRYEDIRRPVFLAHGLSDSVVDYEHTWRMQKMLRLRGTPPHLVMMRGVGHSLPYIKQAKRLYDPLLDFLDKNLKYLSTGWSYENDADL